MTVTPKNLDLTFARWEGAPAVLVKEDGSSVAAYWLKGKDWLQIHPAVISVNAALRSKEKLEQEFGKLPPLPMGNL